jgi:hypothetical protein
MTIFAAPFMTIITEYSWYLWPLCFVAGGLASWLLYAGKGLMSGAGKIEQRLMVVSRFFVVSFLFFLLLSPFLKTVNKRVEKPVLAIAIDQSTSVTAKVDSIDLRNRINAGIELLKKNLDDKIDRHECNCVYFQLWRNSNYLVCSLLLIVGLIFGYPIYL